MPIINTRALDGDAAVALIETLAKEHNLAVAIVTPADLHYHLQGSGSTPEPDVLQFFQLEKDALVHEMRDRGIDYVIEELVPAFLNDRTAS